ncbi:MAG: NAD(+)/NADH kinase [Desulfovibrionaceae bacterium]|nr:NAD(+)/NADH kinase [Desulfovibrionaceae bacterium]
MLARTVSRAYKHSMESLNLRHVLIVTKARVPEAAELGQVIARWIRGRCDGLNIIPAEQDSPHYDDPELDLVLVLGGDGTILGVARRLFGRKIPLVSINFGRVGFLSDIEPDSWEESLTAMLEGSEYRSLAGLRWSLFRYGHLVNSGHAVNDVVISRAAMARLVYVDISTNGERMGDVRADGFLLSTPMGSSGYSVSAGGPLLHPSLDVVSFVPVCPFLNTIPTMVFPCHTVFRFHLLPGTTESYLTLDGQEGHLMQTNDIVEVECVPDSVRFLGRGLSFIERLRTRSFILQNPLTYREKLTAPQPVKSESEDE